MDAAGHAGTLGYVCESVSSHGAIRRYRDREEGSRPVSTVGRGVDQEAHRGESQGPARWKVSAAFARATPHAYFAQETRPDSGNADLPRRAVAELPGDPHG